MIKISCYWLIVLILIFGQFSFGQTNVGSGSYTTVYPGADSSGRNGYPSGSPQLSKIASSKPVPTNDWWSKLVKEDHADNLFNYPMTLKTTNNGLVVTYIPWGVIGDNKAIEVGLSELNASKATAADHSDWTVTMNWNDGTRDLDATTGIGMPFIYFKKNSEATAAVKINSGTVTIQDELLIIENASSGADFVVFAPDGSTWSNIGSSYTSSLNGKNYWSIAMLPQSTTNVLNVAQAYKKYAYVFPTSTTASWQYNQTTSKLITEFVVKTEVKEGSYNKMLMGLLPHQWSKLESTSPTPSEQSYESVRGELKMLEGNSFKVEYAFSGILPTLPYLVNYSQGFNPAKLDQKISIIENEALATWTDSYNEGQMMNRMIQTARIADQMGNKEKLDKMVATIKERLENWLSYQSGEVAFLFYYNNSWSTLLGYPAGHGQDSNINDHHFHWGYFIHAAAFVEQFKPGWANKWGGMINLLIRDAASTNRNDSMFPFLRNFSPYAGHSWANGFASFPQGNDQESSSESMQFASSLIHWGSVTNNDSIRDLGIYIYTTEQSAVENYWFNMYNRVFDSQQQYKLVSRIWGNSYDNGTFWTSDIAASYGIELYPIHGGSLYLGHNKTYATELWNEMTLNTGILSNQENPNLWHDTYWKFLSLTDAQAAINLYDSYPQRNLKFGISDAQTYHWLHAMNALGPVDASITANHPIAVAFTNKSGLTTYVAQNYSNNQISVNFSDGFTLVAPGKKLTTSRDVDISGNLSSDFNQSYVGGSVNLIYSSLNNRITKVEFYDGTNLISTDYNSPFQSQPKGLELGIHGMYAKAYVGDRLSISNIVTVQVGEQVPYGELNPIPGTIEAGFFDKFEGGVGQNITYFDSSEFNHGTNRLDEYVDTVLDSTEGMNVGWITAGEWLEYSVDVKTSGTYSVDIRYTCGNPSGGGPMHFELDGQVVGNPISFSTTSYWDRWSTMIVREIPLPAGKHILRVYAYDGEFNLGKMIFSRTGDLDYDPPVADAGPNISTMASKGSVILDGSGTYEPAGKSITYSWSQIYGPSSLFFANSSNFSTQISNLEIGVYKCLLTVSDGTYISTDQVKIIVSESGNSLPSISINSPDNEASFSEEEAIEISTLVSDLDGTISKVEFYAGNIKIGETSSAPFDYTWTNPSIGIHQITAKAIDNQGGEKTSQAVVVSVNEVFDCSITDNESIQGTFSEGYKTTFETIGSQVKVSITLHDKDKSGVVAYIWKENPFQETQMDHITGTTFSKTLGGLTVGQTISYAVKFTYARGLVVTKYMNYVVGDDCNGYTSDTEGPNNFTATLGEVGSRSVEILLQANDNSGSVIYQVANGQEQNTITGSSGVQTSLIINNLNPETTYNFSVTAKDLSQNMASVNPIELQATTSENTNTECSGTENKASQGSFTNGYNYSFVTNGSRVTFTFELLDKDKTGIVAYLWRKSPFTESDMVGSGNTFNVTLDGFTQGQSISYACKFAFAGGMAVTKYLSYKVGNDCNSNSDTENNTNSSEDIEPEEPITEDSSPLVIIYPNPTINRVYIYFSEGKIDKLELYTILGEKIKEKTSETYFIDVDDFSSGLYIIKVYQGINYTTHKLIIP